MATALPRHSSAPTVDLDPDRLLAFAVRWYRHGGGSPQEIWEAFKLTPDEFFTEVIALLDQPDAARVNPGTRQALRSVARRRLWLAA